MSLKSKLCIFPEDKNFNRRKVLLCEFHKINFCKKIRLIHKSGFADCQLESCCHLQQTSTHFITYTEILTLLHHDFALGISLNKTNISYIEFSFMSLKVSHRFQDHNPKGKHYSKISTIL